ncbi:MAG: DinB family protein [Gemmatimonadales bacterium]
MELVWIERMMIRELETLRNDIAALPDDPMLWQTLPGVTNSIGTLALHLAGNLQHFVGTVLGRTGYVRHRDVEFSARGLPRADVLAGIERAKQAVSAVLLGQPIDLLAEYPETVGGKYRVTTGDWLIHLEAHLAYHVGQAGYLRRILMASPVAVPAVGLPSLATARKVAE